MTKAGDDKIKSVHDNSRDQHGRLRLPFEKLLPLIVMICGYVTDVVYVAINGRNLINSDASAEMMLGRLLNTTGGIITDKWHYSSELRVLNTQLVYRIAMALFPDNWHYARVFSVSVFLLILIISALFLVRVAKLGTAGLWWCAVIVMPVGQWYGWNVLYNSYYIPHIVISILSVGLLVLYIDESQKIQTARSQKVMLSVLICALGFTAGLGGTRQLMICFVPAFAASLFMFAEDFMSVNGFWQSPKQGAKKSTGDKAIVAALFSSFMMLLSSAIGYLVNVCVLSKICSFKNYSDTMVTDFSLSNVITCIGDCIALIGWKGGKKLLSISGVAGVLGVCIGAVAFVTLCICVFRKKQSSLQRFLTLFIAASFGVCLISYSQTESYNCSYWVTFLPFLFLALFIWIGSRFESRSNDSDGNKGNSDCLDPKSGKVYKTDVYAKKQGCVCVVAAIICVICGISTMHDPYISWCPNDLSIQNAETWLENNGYTQGCATFWNSDVITELSDGKIEMWDVEDMNQLTSHQWLQSTSHDTTMPDGKFFIIVGTDEYTSNADSWKLPSMVDHVVYGDDNYFIFSFDSVAEYLK